MIFYSLFKKAETDELRVIRYSDIMTIHADHLGKLNKEWLNPMATFDQDKMPAPLLRVRQEVTILHPIIEGNLEPYKNGFMKYYDNIKLHLLSNGYIDEPNPDRQEWVLNDKGKLMKELGGHRNYVRHRRREINILKNQSKVNNWLIAATILAAVMPFVDDMFCERRKKASANELKKESNRDTVVQPTRQQTKLTTP